MSPNCSTLSEFPQLLPNKVFHLYPVKILPLERHAQVSLVTKHVRIIRFPSLFGIIYKANQQNFIQYIIYD